MQICLIHFKISNLSNSRITGNKRLKEIFTVDSDMPTDFKPLMKPEVFPQKFINPVLKIKKRVENYLASVGAKSDLLGWVIPLDLKDEIIEKMKKFQEEYLEAKANMVNTYAEVCEEHIADIAQRCDGFEHCDELCQIVRSAQPSVSYIERQVDFKLMSPQVITVADNKEQEVVVEGLFDRMIHDVAQKALKAMDSKPRAQIKTIQAFAMKFNGLVYLDNRYEAIADQLNSATSRFKMQPNKDYSVTESSSLVGTLAVLANEPKMKDLIEREVGLFPTMNFAPEEEPEVADAAQEEPEVIEAAQEESEVVDAAAVETPEEDTQQNSKPDEEEIAWGWEVEGEDEPSSDTGDSLIEDEPEPSEEESFEFNAIPEPEFTIDPKDVPADQDALDTFAQELGQQIGNSIEDESDNSYMVAGDSDEPEELAFDW